MLAQEIQVEVLVLRRQGKGVRAIAREMNLSRNTVRAILRADRVRKYQARPQKLSKLAPHYAYLRERIAAEAGAPLAATALLREIRERGYTGGLTLLKTFLAQNRPAVVPAQVKRYETEPGAQLQIDFVVFRTGPSPLRAFTACLGYSRMAYVEYTDNERAETWTACLERALEYFGGVPLKVLSDNPKAIVIKRDAYGEGKHRFHSGFSDFVKHYGITPKLCAPYRAQTKGKVERFHRYLRDSFFRPLQTQMLPAEVDVATANREVRIWLDEVANVRVHATLKEKPIERFAAEKLALQPLPLPYAGESVVSVDTPQSTPRVPIPTESLQHPLAMYAAFAAEIAA
jgi:transposase